MDRRNFLTTAAVGAATLATTAMAEHHNKSGKGHHHHNLPKGTLSKSDRAKVIEVALDCIQTAMACEVHCDQMLAMGDSSMAKCLSTVKNTTSACRNVYELASYNTANEKSLKGIIAACVGICEDCAKECEAHKDKHAECKACYNSCQECIKVFKSLS